MTVTETVTDTVTDTWTDKLLAATEKLLAVTDKLLAVTENGCNRGRKLKNGGVAAVNASADSLTLAIARRARWRPEC